MRSLGEVLVTLGLVLLLFCVYELFWTGVATHQAQGALRHQLEQNWRDLPRGAEPTSERPKEPFHVAIGKGIGIIRIPRLGKDWSWVVVQGVGLDQLKKGPGHYPKTAMPGQVGNFAVASHRATNGAPFAYLDEVEKGDKVYIETAAATYTYVVQRSEIVLPTDLDVVDPVPNHPGEKPTKRRITLTTCHPRWASTYRLIVYGVLKSEKAKSSQSSTSAQALDSGRG